MRAYRGGSWAMALVALVGGCNSMQSGDSTRVVSQMVNPAAAQRPLRTVVVVAMVSREDLRRQIEEEFVTQLQPHGVQALASYRLMPEPGQVSRERLRQEAERNGADAAVVAGLLRVEHRETVDPGTAVSGHGEFRPGYPALSYQAYDQAPETMRERVAVVETKVVDPRRDEVLWTARTETISMADPSKDVPGFVWALVKQMQKDGLIP